jgi:hypothetical protein
MLIRSTQEKYHFIGVKAMANKNRVSGRNSRGSNQVKQEGEQMMPEELQSEKEQTSIEHQPEELEVHEETGQEQAQQEE